VTSRPAPLVIAHRGSSGELPENTLAAFALAVRQGADWIETDLHLTKDGAVVLTHDAELGGLGAPGEVRERTLAEIQALDAGGGEPVPTLCEVLDRFASHVAFNLELKRGERADYEGLEATVLGEVERRGLLGRMLFSSFYDPVLARLRSLSPAARLGLLLSVRYPRGAIERARSLGAETLHPEAPLVTRELVDAAHAAGLAVLPFTVDDPGEMERLLRLGVDGLFTNFPARMRGVLDGLGLRNY
jgi:glycerophosphoryl diester phosphodiesterase